jgi:diguanylate cyclase (GGDEF)-like protein
MFGLAPSKTRINQAVQEKKKDKQESFKEIIQESKARQLQNKEDQERLSQSLKKVRDLEQTRAAESRKIDAAVVRGEDLDRLALLDPLTDLYNHRTFIKELKSELNRAKRYQHPVALCIVSIDNFGDLSKQYGGLTTDAILKIIGNVVKHGIREVDISGRYEKNQFIVALTKSSVSGGAIVAERIRQRIAAQAITYNWESFSLTASFGVAAYPEQAGEWDELIARALDAMEHATARGGDRVLAV